MSAVQQRIPQPASAPQAAAPSAPPSPAPPAPAVRSLAGRRVLAALRIVVGWTFLWAFLDKAFGLRFSTEPANAWIQGGSPTTGYLMGASDGAFGGLFASLAGQAWVDWLFMIGLLGVGVALILGIGLRVAAVAGVLIAGMMYLSQLPIVAGATNPVSTTHWYYILLFPLFALLDAGRTWGLAGLWERTPIVRVAAWLR